MDDLVTWLRQQLDEDERLALGAAAAPWTAEDETGYLRYGEYGWTVFGAGVETEDSEVGKDTARHIARWDPSRVLAEVEAKRLRLLVLSGIANDPPPFSGLAWNFLKIEAHPYRTRPGFRDEWRLT